MSESPQVPAGARADAVVSLPVGQRRLSRQLLTDPRRPAVAAALISLTLLAGGCGGASLDAASSCKEFMNASPEEQNSAVSRVASEYGAGNAVTPLGRPNINYLCAKFPEWTLGEVVQRTG